MKTADDEQSCMEKCMAGCCTNIIEGLFIVMKTYDREEMWLNRQLTQVKEHVAEQLSRAACARARQALEGYFSCSISVQINQYCDVASISVLTKNEK